MTDVDLTPNRKVHPGQLELLGFFQYEQLPPYLQEVSKPFRLLAIQIVNRDSGYPAEQTVALRKLLEAKDSAVRAALPRAADLPAHR